MVCFLVMLNYFDVALVVSYGVFDLFIFFSAAAGSLSLKSAWMNAVADFC